MTGQPERPGAQRWVPPDGDIPALRAAAPGCRGCELWAPATQVVFSSGDPRAPLVLVGEQPGDKEDREGEPFVGPAGRLLDEVLEAAGTSRADVYLTNAVKHFRFEERGPRRIHKTPAVGHIRACLPWLTAELAAVGPRVVVALGATAARAVLGRDESVTDLRGRVLDPPDAPLRTLVTAHPSSVLRVRGSAERAAAKSALVADLRIAVAAVR